MRKTGILVRLAQHIAQSYRPIWEASDRKAAFELCNQIRKREDLPEYTWDKFDEGWQYRTIFAENYEQAKEEFLNLVFGWW